MTAFKSVIDNLMIRISVIIGLTVGLIVGSFLPWYLIIASWIGATAYVSYITHREHVIEKTNLGILLETLQKQYE